MERTQSYPLQSHVDNYLAQRERGIFTINDPLNYLGEASLYQEFVKWFRGSSLPTMQSVCVQQAIASEQFANEDRANGCPPMRDASRYKPTKEELVLKIWNDLRENLQTRKRPANTENVRELYRFLYRAGMYLGFDKSRDIKQRNMLNMIERFLLDSESMSDTFFVLRVSMFFRIMPV